VNKLDPLFDLKQFAVAFGAATHDLLLKHKKSQPVARPEAGAASVAADYLRDDREAVHDVRPGKKEK